MKFYSHHLMRILTYFYDLKCTALSLVYLILIKNLQKYVHTKRYRLWTKKTKRAIKSPFFPTQFATLHYGQNILILTVNVRHSSFLNQQKSDSNSNNITLAKFYFLLFSTKNYFFWIILNINRKKGRIDLHISSFC